MYVQDEININTLANGPEKALTAAKWLPLLGIFAIIGAGLIKWRNA